MDDPVTINVSIPHTSAMRLRGLIRAEFHRILKCRNALLEDRAAIRRYMSLGPQDNGASKSMLNHNTQALDHTVNVVRGLFSVFEVISPNEADDWNVAWQKQFEKVNNC